jgi:purine-binding chemotaxis protein CheW
MTDTSVAERQGQEAAEGVTQLAGKYLTFSLAGETYGLEILKVQEIIRMMEVTRVPRTPDFVRGVINLRGKVLPVIDLNQKFGLGLTAQADRTCIVVVQIVRHESMVIMGLIVDAVSEVLDIPASAIEPTPELGATIDADFILGMGKMENKVIMLLDAEKVLTSAEVNTVATVGESTDELT